MAVSNALVDLDAVCQRLAIQKLSKLAFLSYFALVLLQIPLFPSSLHILSLGRRLVPLRNALLLQLQGEQLFD